ncbi:MAG: SPOR domain-containing protein [Bacteroidales bacterium]|nr:SPOR domain-containing protein [Bacteroidales bacterium]
MKVILFNFSVLFFLTLHFSGYCQTYNSNIIEKLNANSQTEGKISINQSADIDQLINNYSIQNSQSQKVEGYRIQIYSGTGANARKESQEARAIFRENMPNESIKIEYNAPFWRVRVGCFRHKHEALSLLRQTKYIFPHCYIVRDSNIALSELK